MPTSYNRPICEKCEQDLTDKEIKAKLKTCTICQRRLRVQLQMELCKPRDKQ